MKVWSVCVWQVPFERSQWRRLSFHDSVPAVAEPLKAIVWPTRHVVPATGELIVGVGGVPAVIVSVSVSVRPPLSVTRRRTETAPGEV